MSAGSFDVFVAKVSSDGNTVLWAKRHGGTGADYMTALAVDSAVDVATAGYFSGSIDLGGGGQSAGGSTDIFVAKYSGVDGSWKWSKVFGASGSDAAYGIATDPRTGNVVVTGAFNGTVDFSNGSSGSGVLVASGSSAIFVANYTSGGAFAWAKSFGGQVSGGDIGYGVAVDGNGNVAVTGGCKSSIDFGGGLTMGNGVAANFFVAKYSAGGGYLSSKRVNGTWPALGKSVAFDSAGNVFTAGYFGGTIDFGGGSLSSGPANQDGLVVGYGP